MAIYLITGLPGSGKSYYTVRLLLLTFCDMMGDGYYDVKEEFVIVSNIEGLTVDHVDLEQAVKDYGGVDKFFSFEAQEKVCEKYKALGKKVVYFIDECQDYFPRAYKTREVLNFFEKHRHLGFDIYLCTQDAPRASRDILSLSEYELRASPRSTTFGSFFYVKYIKRLKVQSFPLKKDKFVFDYYKSCRQAESQKIRHPMRFMIMGVVAFVFFAFWFFKVNILDRWTKPSEAHASVSSGSVPAGSAPAGSAPAGSAKPNFHYLLLDSFITFAPDGQVEKVRVIDPYTHRAARPEDLPYKVALVRTFTGALEVYGLLDPKQPLPRPRPRPSGPGEQNERDGDPGTFGNPGPRPGQEQPIPAS